MLLLPQVNEITQQTRSKMITLYHGTTKENAELIKQSGKLSAPVYMTPNFDTAEEYAANNSPDYVVIELYVDESDLTYDSEFCGNESDLIQESLENGSVVSEVDLDITNCDFKYFEDYELVE